MKINFKKINKITFKEIPCKKKIIIGAVSAVVLLAIAGGVWMLHSIDKNGKNTNVVYVNTVKQIMNPGGDAGRINRFAGEVETQKQVDVQLSQDRVVKDIFVEEGQKVSVGTVLFTYNTEQDNDKLSKAELELERISNDITTKRTAVGVAQQSGDQLEVLQAQTELKQSEYEKKTKEVEIQKLKDSIENAEVKSQIDGIVKSINNGESNGAEPSAFMTIIAMGNFRIKGKVNEQNIGSVMPGQQVIVHSRVDKDIIWKGTMTEVDMQRPENGNENFQGGDPSIQSNSYPFYVELESSDGLMLGQHVYIEPDFGQLKEKKGIWLDESFVIQEDNKTYVWADNGRGKLEKRKVEIGKHDEEMFQCEIKKGLEEGDKITFPEPGLKEGMKTAVGKNNELGMNNPPVSDEMPQVNDPDTKNQAEETIEGEMGDEQ